MVHGNASLEIIASAFTPMLIGADPLEPRVIQDRLFHEHIKVGPGGRLCRRARRHRHRAVGSPGQGARPARVEAPGRRVAARAAVLRVDRRQRSAHRGRGVPRRREVARARAGAGEDPLRRRQDGARRRPRRRHRQGAGRAQAGGRRLPARLRLQQRLLRAGRDPRRPRARGARLRVVRGAGAALSRRELRQGGRRARHRGLGRRAGVHAAGHQAPDRGRAWTSSSRTS